MKSRALLAIPLLAAVAPRLPADVEKDGIIDTHLHAIAFAPDGLDDAARWMDENGVIRGVVHPIDASRPKNDKERDEMLAHFKKHAGKLERFCIIKPGEAASVGEAVKILEREKKDGAIGFGEHYGTGLMFDDPGNMLLYEACAKAGLPVMFHMDGKQNKDKPGYPHLENALRSHPGCTFIAHGPNWWKGMGSGDCDRLLGKYPNLYADISAGSGASALAKDMQATAGFMIKHRGKLLFGTDCGWWTFDKNPAPAPQFVLMKTLDIPDDVKADIYKGNAVRLFGFKMK